MTRHEVPGSKPGSRAISLLALAAGLVLSLMALAGGAAQEAPPETGDYLVVRHVLYATGDGTVAYEEESRTRVSAQFVVNKHIWAADSIPVTVAFNGDGAPAGHDGAALIQQAISSWNSAGSNFSFAWAGSSTGGTGSCSANIDVDGVNTIRFEKLPGATLGQTCTVYPPGNNSKLVEFDMQLDSDAQWNSGLPVPGNKYDLPTTILHELGHAAGLGHSAQNEAVMYFQVNAGQNKRTLTADDKEGIRAAYGAGAVPTPTTAATPVPTVPGVPVLERARAPLLARD